jgi:hypothetical protein
VALSARTSRWKGLLEAQVWVGDELHFPGCVLRVTAPREPCYKFNAVMGYPQAARDMMLAGCCGFYLAVKQGGTIEAGQRHAGAGPARPVDCRGVPGPADQASALKGGLRAVPWGAHL